MSTLGIFHRPSAQGPLNMSRNGSSGPIATAAIIPAVAKASSGNPNPILDPSWLQPHRHRNLVIGQALFMQPNGSGK